MVLEADERAARVAELLAKKQAEQKERDAVKRRMAEDAVRVASRGGTACVAVEPATSSSAAAAQH
jgi:hypothetical protein